MTDLRERLKKTIGDGIHKEFGDHDGWDNELNELIDAVVKVIEDGAVIVPTREYARRLTENLDLKVAMEAARIVLRTAESQHYTYDGGSSEVILSLKKICKAALEDLGEGK